MILVQGTSTCKNYHREKLIHVMYMYGDNGSMHHSASQQGSIRQQLVEVVCMSTAQHSTNRKSNTDTCEYDSLQHHQASWQEPAEAGMQIRAWNIKP